VRKSCGNKEVDMPTVTTGVKFGRIPVREGLTGLDDPKPPRQFGNRLHDRTPIQLLRSKGKNPHVAEAVRDKITTRIGGRSTVGDLPVEIELVFGLFRPP
jgi:hypothetical protein